jgi:3-methylcrotonyl-CoA carboxylase alpha subunit
LRVASGEPLPCGQDALTIRGHAVEVRLYAEDPEREFLPQTGRLEHLSFPDENSHVRVDAGVRAGDAVSIHYDPMLAKLIVWDVDRPSALRRLRGVLAETRIVGLPTNVRFLEAIAAHPAFIGAEIDTGFIDRYRPDLLPKAAPASARELAFATLGVLLERANEARGRARRSPDRHSPWNRTDGWRLTEEAADTVSFREGGQVATVRVVYARNGYELTLPDGRCLLARGEFAPDGTLDADFDGARLSSVWVRQGCDLHIFHSGGSHRLSLVDPLADASAAELGGERVTAPMPGRITAVLTGPGAAVELGQPLVVMEAMKMEHTIKALRPGTVQAVRYGIGDQVEEGALLVEFADEQP